MNLLDLLMHSEHPCRRHVTITNKTKDPQDMAIALNNNKIFTQQILFIVTIKNRPTYLYYSQMSTLTLLKY